MQQLKPLHSGLDRNTLQQKAIAEVGNAVLLQQKAIVEAGNAVLLMKVKNLETIV